MTTSTMESTFFQTTSSKVAIWLFIISDALTFSALLVGYGFMRMLSPSWPVRTEIFDMRLITFMTFVLISSSALMAMAVAAAQNRNQSHAVKLLLGTIGGGLVFLGCQAYEWTHFIREGARPFSNPWGVPQFSATFFVVTGFHGLHVLSGVVALGVIAYRALRNNYSASGIEVAGLYWHFIDVVWVFVFAFFYLL
ncbi:MAG TPA: cytochrome c oxidase subunit 3 [Terriglobia bacterium]|nr:cytochrome c oxidase subunit 3 [Terriglobia bacterium]